MPAQHFHTSARLLLSHDLSLSRLLSDVAVANANGLRGPQKQLLLLLLLFKSHQVKVHLASILLLFSKNLHLDKPKDVTAGEAWIP